MKILIYISLKFVSNGPPGPMGLVYQCIYAPDSKVHGAYMGPTWGRQDPGGLHVGPMNLAIRGVTWPQWVEEVAQRPLTKVVFWLTSSSYLYLISSYSVATITKINNSYFIADTWYLFGNGFVQLTHWGLVTPYGVGDLGQHWFR